MQNIQRSLVDRRSLNWLQVNRLHYNTADYVEKSPKEYSLQVQKSTAYRSKRVQPTVQKSTAYTRLDCCCFNAAQIVLTPPAPRNGGPFLPFFGQAGQVDPLVGWRSCY